MNRQLTFGLALLAAGLTSCSELKHDDAALSHVEASISAFGGISTKTLPGNIVGDELLMDWMPGDQIGIVNSNASVSCFTNVCDAPSAVGDFTGLLSGSPVYAFYPYVEDVQDITAVPFQIPANQIYDGPASIGQYDVRVARSIADTPAGFRMTFSSLTCLLRFEVDMSGLVAYTEQDESEYAEPYTFIGDKEAISFFEGEEVVALNLSAGRDGDPALTCSDEAFFLVDLTSETPRLATSPEFAGEYPTSLVLLVDTDFVNIPVAGSETAVFYAVVAPGAVAGTMMEINLTSQVGNMGHWICFRVPLAVDLVAGHYYTVPLRPSALEGSDVLCWQFEEFEDIDDSEEAGDYGEE